jgi:hypothetical protein
MIFELLVALAAFGGCTFICRQLIKQQQSMPTAVFLVAYIGLFFIGALGIHFDAEGYFSDWIASIGVREVYLSQDQRWLHLISILSPLIMVPLGCLLAPFATVWIRPILSKLTKKSSLGIFAITFPIIAAYPFGSFWFSLALLWCFTILIFHANLKWIQTDFFQKISFGHLLTTCIVICSLILIKNNAAGSIVAFLVQYQDQTSLLAQRASLTIGLPIWYWPLAYSLLPITSAAYLLQTPRPTLYRKTAALIGTCWILFAHFFKGQIFFFILFVVFCAGASRPRWLVKAAGITGSIAIGLLSIFYLTASGLSGDPKQSWLLLTHFFYRLGTNQHFYIAFFPDVSPFLGFDFGHAPHADAQLVYGFMYPADVMNASGSTAGPYISNAWAQGGLPFVLIYGFVAGAILQWYWLMAEELHGTIRIILRGRILFMAFLLAQLSFRDFLFSGWGLVWGCMGILMMKALIREQPGGPSTANIP